MTRDGKYQYVVVRFYKGNWSRNNFHIYSMTTTNREKVVEYAKTLVKKYPSNYEWRVMTTEDANKKYKEYREWLRKYEREQLEKRFPVRYVGQTAREEIAEMMQKTINK